MNPSKSLMVLCILCLLVAVYVFAVNFVVANDTMFANQQVLPIQPENITESKNATDITETMSLGASLSVTVYPRYGILPIHSCVLGDLKWIHRIFMWLLYPLGLVGLIRANRVVLVWDDDKGASDLLYGIGLVVGVFVAGFFLGFTPIRLIHDLGWALRTYAVATFGFIGVLFLLRLYAYTHADAWRKIEHLKKKVW